jgi:glycosyltransferase involved in cell wall biosynthesis
MKKLPISVSMISGAEAPRIGRALESVAGWTSEIIVVLNAEVTDGTDRIAATHGAKVFRELWKGHVAQKNSAAMKAAQDWIFGLDADEAVSPDLRAEIETVLTDRAKAERFAGFSCPRLAWYCGRWIRHGDWYPDRQTRLWRRGHAKWGGQDPHDKLEVSGQVGRLQSEILHYTSDTLERLVIKTMAYAEDFVRHCAQDGRRVRYLDLLMRPAWRFVRGYLLRRGFLDGWQGVSVAWMGAFYTFLRYAKALEAQQQIPGRSGTAPAPRSEPRNPNSDPPLPQGLAARTNPK